MKQTMKQFCQYCRKIDHLEGGFICLQQFKAWMNNSLNSLRCQALRHKREDDYDNQEWQCYRIKDHPGVHKINFGEGCGEGWTGAQQ